MDRRKFFGAIAGLTGIAIFPRKSESAQSEGLSHEQMAEVILNHPDTVFLEGHADEFGKSRLHGCGMWEPDGNQISCDDILSVTGCVVKTRSFLLGRLTEEFLFDISNPLLKVIRLFDTPNRYFARLKEKWVEL